MIADLTLAASGMLAMGGLGDLGGMLIVLMIVYIALLVFMIASMWALFAKAGQPGWAVVVPIYNWYIICKMSGKSGWWVLYLCIPIVNVITGVILSITWCSKVAEDFGRGSGTAIGLFFLPVVFVPILAFGSAQYGGRTPSTPPPAPVS